MGSWTYPTKPTQECIAQQNTSSGMDKNALKPKIKNDKWGKTTQVIKSFQKMFNGFTEAKTTSIHTQNVDLSSQLLGFTKKMSFQLG